MEQQWTAIENETVEQKESNSAELNHWKTD